MEEMSTEHKQTNFLSKEGNRHGKLRVRLISKGGKGIMDAGGKN